MSTKAVLQTQAKGPDRLSSSEHPPPPSNTPAAERQRRSSMATRYSEAQPISSPTTPGFSVGGAPSPGGQEGHSYPPSQSPSSTDTDAPYSSRRPLSDRSDSEYSAPPALPRYTSHASASGLSPLNPSSGAAGARPHTRTGSNYGSGAHPLSNSTFADSSPTLAEHPASSTSSFAEKKGYHRARTGERSPVEDDGYASPAGRRRGQPNGVAGLYRKLNGDFIGDDGRDERHTKLPKLGYLEGIKFLSAIVALNGTLFDATLNTSDYSAIQRGSPLYITRSFGLALTFFLILTGRCLSAALWDLPQAQQSSAALNKYGPGATPSISWPRLTRGMLIRPFRFVLPVLVVAGIQWGLGNGGSTSNCNAVGMDEPLWKQIRNFGGFATLVFDLFTYFELDTTAGKVFSGNLWTVPWLFQSGYCVYVVHMMLGNLSSNRYWVYGLLAFFSWTSFNYFYLAIIGLVITDMHVHGQFTRVQQWPIYSRMIVWVVLAGIACVTQFINPVRDGLNNGLATINVTNHADLQFADSIFATCFLVALETSTVAQIIFGNVVLRLLGKLAAGIYLLSGILTFTLVPNLALSMHNAGSAGSAILGVSWVVLFAASFGLAIPFHFFIELPSKCVGEIFCEFIEHWGVESGVAPPRRRRDDVKAPVPRKAGQ